MTTKIKICITGDGRLIENLTGWPLTTGITCPACTQGGLVWAENGYAPGYRICSHCGRGWMTSPKDLGVVEISIPEIDGIQEWYLPKEIDPDWKENGDGVNLIRAHMWGVHGGRGMAHSEEECPLYRKTNE